MLPQMPALNAPCTSRSLLEPSSQPAMNVRDGVTFMTPASRGNFPTSIPASRDKALSPTIIG